MMTLRCVLDQNVANTRGLFGNPFRKWKRVCVFPIDINCMLFVHWFMNGKGLGKKEISLI